MARPIGSTRVTLAKMLERAFADRGVEVEVSPENLCPAQGYYRTNVMADVYRWEGHFRIKTPHGWKDATLDSWSTMTDCVRHGLELHEEKWLAWEASAKQDRTHPAIARRDARLSGAA